MSTDLTPKTSPLSKTRRWAAVAVLSASLVVISIDMTILNVALPHITADLEATSAQQLWIVDIYPLATAQMMTETVAAIEDRDRRVIPLPCDIRPDPDRPLVYVSLGTLQGHRHRLLARIARACRRAGAQVLVSLGGQSADVLGS